MKPLTPLALPRASTPTPSDGHVWRFGLHRSQNFRCLRNIVAQSSLSTVYRPHAFNSGCHQPPLACDPRTKGCGSRCFTSVFPLGPRSPTQWGGRDIPFGQSKPITDASPSGAFWHAPSSRPSKPIRHVDSSKPRSPPQPSASRDLHQHHVSRVTPETSTMTPKVFRPRSSQQPSHDLRRNRAMTEP